MADPLKATESLLLVAPWDVAPEPLRKAAEVASITGQLADAYAHRLIGFDQATRRTLAEWNTAAVAAARNGDEIPDKPDPDKGAIWRQARVDQHKEAAADYHAALIKLDRLLHDVELRRAWADACRAEHARTIDAITQAQAVIRRGDHVARWHHGMVTVLSQFGVWDNPYLAAPTEAVAWRQPLADPFDRTPTTLTDAAEPALT